MMFNSLKFTESFLWPCIRSQALCQPGVCGEMSESICGSLMSRISLLNLYSLGLLPSTSGITAQARRLCAVLVPFPPTLLFSLAVQLRREFLPSSQNKPVPTSNEVAGVCGQQCPGIPASKLWESREQPQRRTL